MANEQTTTIPEKKMTHQAAYRKQIAQAGGGSAALVVAYTVNQAFGIQPPPEVVVAATAGLYQAIGYFKREVIQ